MMIQYSNIEELEAMGGIARKSFYLSQQAVSVLLVVVKLRLAYPCLSKQILTSLYFFIDNDISILIPILLLKNFVSKLRSVVI